MSETINPKIFENGKPAYYKGRKCWYHQSYSGYTSYSSGIHCSSDEVIIRFSEKCFNDGIDWTETADTRWEELKTKP